MMLKPIRLLILLAAWAVSAGVAHAAPLPVVASFSILGDITKTVGGDAVTVQTLVGSDGDAHGYQPTPGDAKAIAQAKLVIVNGFGFEGWVDRLIKASGYKGPVVVATRAVVQTGTDPHAWQDIANGRQYAAAIAAALTTAIPDQAVAIKTRAEQYDRQLATLDQKIRAKIAAVPAQQRRIITSHDAFGYFGRAYGVTFLAPEGFNGEAEPTPSAIVRLNRQIRQEGIKTVFLENMSDSRLIRQIARDTDATIGGTLYADALSAPHGPAPTYAAMMAYNADLLVAAMQQNKP